MMQLLFVVLLLFTSCERTSSPSSSGAEEVVEQFCQSYFNLHYVDALSYCTEESKKWISLAASNIHESDIETFNQSGDALTVRVTDLQAAATDSVGSATVRVCHYLDVDRIDAAAEMVEEGYFHIDLVKRSGSWRVRMAGLPRSEKQSRD